MPKIDPRTWRMEERECQDCGKVLLGREPFVRVSDIEALCLPCARHHPEIVWMLPHGG